MEVRVCKDSSAKNKNKCWYIIDVDAITSPSYVGITQNMDYKELQIVVSILKSLGIIILDETV